MVIFIDNYKGKAKSTGNEFQIVTLLEVRKSKKEEGKIVARCKEFFVNGLDLKDFVPGDVVQATFEESELLGEKPDLVGLEVVGENVFEDLL